MSSATLTNSNRVRQIAILVSSVEATVARQLLLHLPTEMARQVRAMASKLGPVSAAEKRAILADFQKSAGQGTTQHTQEVTAPSGPEPIESLASMKQDRTAIDAAFAQPHSDALHASMQSESHERSSEIPVEDTSPAWTKLSTEALVRFVQGERTAVVAVVVSQLVPRKAVEVLAQLPKEMNRAVLQRLSQLQDIDPTAMTAIDEHLAERLSDYQHRIESEHENSRRLNALLAAAPPDLQREWKELLGDVPESAEFSRMTKAEERSSGSSLISGVRQSTQATIAELYGDMSITTMDLATETIEPLRSRSSTLVEVEDEVDVLPFTTARPSATIAKPPMEKTTKPIDFARILSLPPQHLAALLSSLDSQTVLLALAGSTPEFMRSFAKLLTPRDAKSLTSKLQLIGPINLRDVDEAQHRIVERAASMLAALEVDRRQAA